MESTIYKIIDSNRHSSIFYGPITTVYGIGIIAIELINNYFFKKIKVNKYFHILIEFIVLMIILSLIEFLGGNILHILFHVDLWNYSNKFMHLGKYVCLFNSIIWGILGVLYIRIIKKFTDKIIGQINKKETAFFIIIFIIDLIFVLITKL